MERCRHLQTERRKMKTFCKNCNQEIALRIVEPYKFTSWKRWVHMDSNITRCYLHAEPKEEKAGN